MFPRRLVLLLVVLAAAVPYLPTLNNYFVQDDFGVVGLLATKPAGYFPRWFVSPWTDNIWGYTPDEIRPFPAVTYQVSALWGAASPVANHVINIAFHAVNALLVLGVAEVAVGLSLGPAAFAALVFAVLPMQAESVAWITGRVDSMPACFYLASFLLYARWRAHPRTSTYVWSVVAFFVALFTKQTTVTLLPALLLYDAIVIRRAVRPFWAWLRPYVPFVLLTLGYLFLRYMLFGEVAREGVLNAEQFRWFLENVSNLLRRMVFGEPGLKLSELGAAARVGAGAAAVGLMAILFGGRRDVALVRPVAYFLVVWIALNVAPTIVTSYTSPRHTYLASVGWALTLAAALEVLWHARPRRVVRRLGVVLAGAVLVAYALQLRQEVRLWGVRSEVSRRAVADVEREAMSASPGTLIIVDVPPRSWAFALPHAVRPPFIREELARRVSVISNSSIYCCSDYLWDPYTREVLRAWTADPARPPVIALRWDPTTGTLSRLSDRQDPFLRTLVDLLLETKDLSSLDRLMLDISNKFVAGRSP
jgi:hypothetical protein